MNQENNPTINPLLDPAIDLKVAEIVRENSIKDEAGRRAASEPMPGPAREAFSLEPDIIVGEYRVRPACDFDLVVLSQLGSKFYSVFMKGEDLDTTPSGQDAWDLCYLMTRPARQSSKLIKESRLSGFRQAAEDEFSFKQTRTLIDISLEAIRQIAASCSTIVEHGSATDDTEVAKSSLPPSGERSTGTGG